MFFPELRATNPAIDPVIDRLEADHRRVSHQLDQVEEAAQALAGDDGDSARQAVADALRILGKGLLAHLDYEERNLQTTVLRLRDSASPPRQEPSMEPLDEAAIHSPAASTSVRTRQIMPLLR